MLREYKKQHKLTIKELAKRMNVSTATVSRILVNKNVGTKAIKSVAKLLNKEVLEVYEYYKQS